MRFLKRKSAFTLIEVISVIAIVIILMGLLFPAVNKAREQAKKQETKAMIGAMEVALAMYYTDLGFYPVEVTGSNNFANTLGKAQGNYGPYIDFDQSEVSVNVALDPWGMSYKYNKTNPNNAGSFDLWSNGPNKVDNSGGNDDIKNW